MKQLSELGVMALQVSGNERLDEAWALDIASFVAKKEQACITAQQEFATFELAMSQVYVCL